ncbi:hypothetical protein FLACOL7796_04087 [Flavobacterium collinsii]|uniref:Integrase catalytic domain-containing protein n=2 Tax=Flavobacterium collinsii TaxID=1114861 RepID=A0ABM8KNJ7_9FLAO|nr:hypothetical protein FLACOL7796_04087 [Flavobacterium collinsii]
MENHLRSIAKTKFRKTTNSSHRYLTVQNILEQDFKTNYSSEVWVSNITYIETDEGCLYLTVIIDLFDRKVIGWSLSESLKAGISNSSNCSLSPIPESIKNFRVLNTLHMTKSLLHSHVLFLLLVPSIGNVRCIVMLQHRDIHYFLFAYSSTLN